jgi:hypothetical protein
MIFRGQINSDKELSFFEVYAGMLMKKGFSRRFAWVFTLGFAAALAGPLLGRIHSLDEVVQRLPRRSAPLRSVPEGSKVQLILEL